MSRRSFIKLLGLFCSSLPFIGKLKWLNTKEPIVEECTGLVFPVTFPLTFKQKQVYKQHLPIISK